MTRDEILNMPAGREMDALVTKRVMGWTYGQTGDDYDGWSAPHGKYILERARHGHFYPSSDIAAAWEVVAKFDLFAIQKNIFWVATFSEGGETYSASGDTAPLAICRAALVNLAEEG